MRSGWAPRKSKKKLPEPVKASKSGSTTQGESQGKKKEKKEKNSPAFLKKRLIPLCLAFPVSDLPRHHASRPSPSSPIAGDSILDIEYIINPGISN